MTTKNMEARREAFDRWYAKNRGVLGCGSYKKEMEVWNAALDSICVELPDEERGSLVPEYDDGYNQALEDCQGALTAAGVAYR